MGMVKGPVQKKLFLRLYHELSYPLWEGAFKKILPEEKIADAVASAKKFADSSASAKERAAHDQKRAEVRAQ